MFIPLFTAHLIGDFLLQTDNDVKNKLNPAVFFKHCTIISLLSYLLCGLWTNWFIPASVFLSHSLIDFLKQKYFVKNEFTYRRRFAVFTVDQLLHIAAVLLIAHYTIVYFNMPGQVSLWISIAGTPYITALVFISGLIIITSVGGIIIDFLTSPYLRQMKDKSPPGLRGFSNGGRIIGYLERSIIFAFILSGNLAGIGFLIAAKSIFRFGEINKPENRMETEYIIIGTLSSFAWAVLIGHLTLFVIQSLLTGNLNE